MLDNYLKHQLFAGHRDFTRLTFLIRNMANIPNLRPS